MSFLHSFTRSRMNRASSSRLSELPQRVESNRMSMVYATPQRLVFKQTSMEVALWDMYLLIQWAYQYLFTANNPSESWTFLNPSLSHPREEPAFLVVGKSLHWLKYHDTRSSLSLSPCETKTIPVSESIWLGAISHCQVQWFPTPVLESLRQYRFLL